MYRPKNGNLVNTELYRWSSRRALSLVHSSLCVLWLVIAVGHSQVECNPTATTIPTAEKFTYETRCIDFELTKIDAITPLANGSLFVVSHGQYWILKPNEVPSLSTARPVSKLVSWTEPPPQSSGVVSADSSASTAKSSTVTTPLTIEAAVNVRVKPQNGACLPADQIILYSWTATNRSLATVFEKDILFTTPNITDIELFRSSKSVDWNRKIDGITSWQNMTIVFQGDSFISMQCKQGQWVEVIHKKVVEVFPGVKSGPPDAMFVKNYVTDQISTATLYLFYGNQFYECSVTGSDACEGPYNLLSEFFTVDHFCPDSKIGRAETNRRFLTAIIVVIVILFSVCVIGLILYFTLKPEHFTYFVNGKVRAANYNRDNLSYEALKQQNEQSNTATGPVECKSVTNATNGKS